ncbi:DUF1835 domain-containing protein [Roseomonas sp. SSH11]|uniref:DUF1835 domain-containing protein n=1 Tax=Pararoseomonas baculiformis TaxID=2820812 RepID=A0ABS4A9K7_9PROT|nr:DUF1835 domain-containing protein [Pararoseomonas baculiformis]
MRAGDPAALRRFLLHHPSAPEAAMQPAKLARLSEAQLVIARELGLPSWPRLKAHVEAMDRVWNRIARGDAAPDRGMATLHIRCGSDIGPTLRQAGFTGDFLEYSDPLCQGPVLDGPGWLERRADFLAERFGAGTGQGREEIAGRLAKAEQGLRSAARSHERVVLWFEHDSYDQLILARCLAHFAEAPPRRLELVSPGHYPGGTRFIGLGQLPPEALRLLWEERVPVPEAALRAGQAVWDMLRAPDPRPLADFARDGLPELPQLARAIRRHCQELPWTLDGLGLSERLILQILAGAPRSVGQVFSDLMMEHEPLPWMSDLILLSIVEDMRKAEPSVLEGAFEGEDRYWAKERLALTPQGHAVLAGQADWLSLRPPPRWLGGVLVPGAAPCWRWDEASATVVKA